MKRPNVEYARALRTGQTDAERSLWRHLRNRQLLDWKFRRQHEVGPYITDFVCTDAWLIVELDGGQHVEQAASDARRTQWLQGAGYRVLRFWNDDVLKNVEGVLDEIVKALAVTPPHPDPLPGGERGSSLAVTPPRIDSFSAGEKGKNFHVSDTPSPPRGEGRGEGKS